MSNGTVLEMRLPAAAVLRSAANDGPAMRALIGTLPERADARRASFEQALARALHWRSSLLDISEAEAEEVVLVSADRASVIHDELTVPLTGSGDGRDLLRRCRESLEDLGAEAADYGLFCVAMLRRFYRLEPMIVRERAA